MKRLLAISLILAAVLLSGCVVTPAYRYSGGHAGYYYGYGASAVYGNGYAYPYAGYYGYDDGPWVPYGGASVYYYDRGGYYRHAEGDHRGRLSTRVREQSGPRTYDHSRRLSQPRPAARSEWQRSNAGRDAGRDRGSRRDRRHQHHRD